MLLSYSEQACHTWRTDVYITSFVHREELFDMVQRWLCNRLDPSDGLRVTQILVCDGFILGETLDALTRLLLATLPVQTYRTQRLHFKGELRDIICRSVQISNPRITELVASYKANPDFFYKEAPVDGTAYIDETDRLIALYRIKRPRRIAEKANRYIAGHIFRMVQNRARQLAEERAQQIGIPLEYLLTPEEEMEREFTLAEEMIAGAFKEGKARFERPPVTINDVGGIKCIGDNSSLHRIEEFILQHPDFTVFERAEHSGSYRAKSLIIDVPWDRDRICRSFIEKRAWEKYANRGISETELRKGLDHLLEGVEPRICIEVTLTTFEELVESELGRSIHEERIINQRGQTVYTGYIPMNVEFLVEYLFAVAVSPQIRIDRLPIKLWGRYLPDTISHHIRRLYYLPEHDALY
jgi:hypothetical protein